MTLIMKIMKIIFIVNINKHENENNSSINIEILKMTNINAK
jgi:hypothetical protein